MWSLLFTGWNTWIHYHILEKECSSFMARTPYLPPLHLRLLFIPFLLAVASHLRIGRQKENSIKKFNASLEHPQAKRAIFDKWVAHKYLKRPFPMSLSAKPKWASSWNDLLNAIIFTCKLDSLFQTLCLAKLYYTRGFDLFFSFLSSCYSDIKIWIDSRSS